MAVVPGPRRHDLINVFSPFYEVWRSSQRSSETLAGFGAAALRQGVDWEGRKEKGREGKKKKMEGRAGEWKGP